MFNYTQFTNDLIKAMTHKYVRRIPKGVTKTGATKYVYYYAGQEGHSKGIAHESEIVQGASFAFGEHGKTRYHAHISKIDGDKVTVQYDDGDKKGQKETMTKKQFQALVHGEHKESIKQAKEKAEKQLKDFQAGKEKGVKVKQSTLDKLEQRVKNLDELTTQNEEPTNQESQEEGLSGLAQRTLDEWNKKKGKKTSTLNSIPDIGDIVQVLYEQDKNAFADAVYKTPAFTKYRSEFLAMPILQGVLRDKIDKILGFKIGLLSNADEQQFKEKILNALRTGKNLDQKDMTFLLDHKILNNLVDKKELDKKIKQFNQSALENQVLSFVKENREEYKDTVKEIDDVMNKITSFNPDITKEDIFRQVSLKELEEMRTYVNDARRLLVAYDQVWNKNNIEKNDLPGMGRTATALFLRNFEQLQDKNKILDTNDSSNILDKMYNAQIQHDSYKTIDSDRLRIFLARVQKAEEFLDKQKELQENPERVAKQKMAVDDLFTNLQNTIHKTPTDMKNFVSEMENVAKTLDNKESAIHFLQEFQKNADQYIKAYDKSHTAEFLQSRFSVTGSKIPKKTLLKRYINFELKDVFPSIPFLDMSFSFIDSDKPLSQVIGDTLKRAQDKEDKVRKSLKFLSIAHQLRKALRTI